MICFYLAIQHMPLGDANAIHQTNPLWTALLAAWLLGERLDRRVLIGITLSLIGVALITGVPLFGEQADVLGARRPARSPVCSRRLRHRAGPAPHRAAARRRVLFPAGHRAAADRSGGARVDRTDAHGVAGAPRCRRHDPTRPSGADPGPAARTSWPSCCVNYLQVALAVLWGLVFFHEVPTLSAGLGMGLIVGGVLLAALRASRAARSSPA